MSPSVPRPFLRGGAGRKEGVERGSCASARSHAHVPSRDGEQKNGRAGPAPCRRKGCADRTAR